uniref:Early nodulin n=1 Tax=Rhabditophanes sp. KR3021 TaxID=114890 RepID=A0AC35UDA7_9BILA
MSSAIANALLFATLSALGLLIITNYLYSNTTPLPIQFKQKGSGNCFVICPRMNTIVTCQVVTTTIFIVADNVSQKNESAQMDFTFHGLGISLVNNILGQEIMSMNKNMSKNEYNSYLPSRDYDHFYCVADNASQKNESAQMDSEMESILHGLGISLVNNILGQEIMSMNKSKIIWEREYKSRFKCFPQGNIDGY